MNTSTVSPLLASSIDPTKVSATVTGILTGLSGVVLLVANVYHFPLTPSAYTDFIQQVGTAVFAIVTGAGSAYALFGLLRKVVVAIFPGKNVQATQKTVI